MTTGTIDEFRIRNELVEEVNDFILLGVYINKESSCKEEINRCLIFERTAMMNM